MKKSKAEAVLRDWQARLRLQEWTVTLETVKGRCLPGTNILGNIVWDANNATATVAVALRRPGAEVVATIRHEMLHLRLADLSATVLTAFNALPKSRRKLATLLFDRADERAVRALEKAFDVTI